MSIHSPEVALIGGGTGSFTLLSELKNFTPNITAIVNMCDDGGSTGILRDELGVLPPGDARQCLVALSDNPNVRDLFSFRFGEGRFEGQSLGNIILSGLEIQHGSFTKAIDVASEILHITGKVTPATLSKHTLVLQDGDEIIRGESNIADSKISSLDAVVRLEPCPIINPQAAEAIESADLVIIAPGNLYASLLPIFAVNGITEALDETDAKIVNVTNLVTKPGQTDNWHVVDYVKAFEKYIGEGRIDAVLYNDEPIRPELLRKYAAEGEYSVSTEKERFREIDARAIGARLVSEAISAQDPNDKKIKRTLIRHDAKQVGRQLMRIFYE
jgi:uncharacterized cofD-like protein